ncbi:MAG: hypothetical protein WA323_13965 [Candidatus Nitrosopolaris sp.]
MEPIVSKYKMLIKTDSDTYAEASLWDCFFDCNSPKHQDLKIAIFKAINRNW